MTQFKCALNCRAAGYDMSLGTPTRSLRYTIDLIKFRLSSSDSSWIFLKLGVSSTPNNNPCATYNEQEQHDKVNKLNISIQRITNLKMRFISDSKFKFGSA